VRHRRSLLFGLLTVGLGLFAWRRLATRLASRRMLRERPRGLLRLAFRLPIVLFRLNLGWLAGHRALLLTHRGRRTGRLHRTVLEVVRYDPFTEESVVVSGWGERSDWYRNLRAHPAVEVQTGGERYVPAQRMLTPDEVYGEIVDYERRYPRYARIFAGQLGVRLDGSEDARGAFAARVRMVAFRPPADTARVPRGFRPR